MKFQLKSFYRYHLRGRWDYWQAQKVLKTGQEPVVIYTMGKVGSLSIYHSIQNYVEQPVFHFHTMKAENIAWAYKTCRSKGWWPDSKSAGNLVYQQKVIPQKPIKFITAIREPIERNISAFFEVFRYYNQVNAMDYLGSMESLQEDFLDELPHEYPLSWLKDELGTCLDIDVYKTKFNYLNKHQKYRNKNTQLLLLRVDLADEEKENQIRKFLNISRFQLKNQNVGKDKDYAKVYAQFKAALELPKSYVERMLESPYCQHFYSSNERKDLFLKWTKS